MNADASAGVDVRGDASAKLPDLPWLACGLLIVRGAAGFIGAWVLESRWGLAQGFDKYSDQFDLSKYKVISLGTVVVLVVFAIMGKIPLTLGVVGHEGSTVIVVLNSLRLLLRDGRG